MTALDHCLALDRRHHAALAEAMRAADSARAFAAVARLTARDPAQPMPPGRLEYWPATQTTGSRIMHIGRAGVSGERAVLQVWP
jgi:hypothetical protein